MQQNLNQNQITTQQLQPSQQPSHSNQNVGSKPQSLVNINYQTAQTNMSNQSQPQIQSTILQNNNYLDPSKFLVQKQYQVSFEIQSLLNSVDGTGMAYPQSQTPTQNNRVQVQQSVSVNKPKVYQVNQAYVHNQPMQHITNPVKVGYVHDQVDSSKNQTQSLHQSLLHNALMSQFINNQNYSPSNQQSSSILYNRSLNNMSPLILQNLQHNLGPMSAPVLGSNYTLKLSPTSNNSQNLTNMPEVELKPYPTMVNTQAINLVSSNENSVQNLIQIHGQPQQINAGILRKSSFNSPIVHLAETALPDQDISALGIDDQKLIQAVSIQNVLSHKIENSNDVLAQLGERIKQILSEKVLDVNQINDFNSSSFNNSGHSANIYTIPHQQHLNENVSSYSPSLSRRSSIDLKEKKNFSKPGKFQPNCEAEVGSELTYLNDSNRAFILGLLGVNQLAQQNIYQAKAQSNVPVVNAALKRPNQPQSNQQYINNHSAKQLTNDNLNQVDLSSKNSNNSPNFEDLFMR